MTGALNVLHVEDDFADAMLLQHALFDADALDLSLEVVRTLREARQKLSKTTYDLVIADLRLPDSADPATTVAKLREHAGGANILVLTGSYGIKADAFGAGVMILDKNAFFHKRDDTKNRALLAQIRSAVSTDDDADALMI
jgi:CheY-like chemotaxis protein